MTKGSNRRFIETAKAELAYAIMKRFPVNENIDAWLEACERVLEVDERIINVPVRQQQERG